VRLVQKNDTGSGEREDVVAVCRYLQSECGVEAVYLVGYSYGSAIGCSVVNDVDIIKVPTTSTPLRPSSSSSPAFCG
jgi:alpha/beta superfamily hydrolase